MIMVSSFEVTACTKKQEKNRVKGHARNRSRLAPSRHLDKDFEAFNHAEEAPPCPLLVHVFRREF
jgi:hypothetical protein